MSRPFFSRERISHFELFDRHAGTIQFPGGAPNLHLTLTRCPSETALNKIKERVRSNIAFDFQVGPAM